MSFLSYYVRCGACGLTSPAVAFGSSGNAPKQLDFIAANSLTGMFEVVSQPLAPPFEQVPLGELARRWSTPSRTLTSPSPHEAELRLTPALDCPRCGASITSGMWGEPAPAERDWVSIEGAIADTRGAAERTDYRFVARDLGFAVRCLHTIDTGEVINHWNLSPIVSEAVDLRAITQHLIAGLVALGSQCSEPRFLGRGARFTERLPPARTKAFMPER